MFKFLIAAAMVLTPVTAKAQVFSDQDIIKGSSWQDSYDIDGPVWVRVNLSTQMAYVYKGNVLVGLTAVTTGRAGHMTPTGTFPIKFKDANHVSNKYHAPMPFTEMLTNDGVALHAGSINAESHGCVHLPKAFAAKLFTMTHVGDTVTIEGSKFDYVFRSM